MKQWSGIECYQGSRDREVREVKRQTQIYTTVDFIKVEHTEQSVEMKRFQLLRIFWGAE